MSRRSLLLLGSALVLCVPATGGGLYLYETREGVVSRWNFERVKEGMTDDHATRLFGEPGRLVPGGEPSKSGWKAFDLPRPGWVPVVSVKGADYLKCWESEGQFYAVTFDRDGRVWTAHDKGDHEPGKLERLAGRMRRLF